jgi:acid phosphatase class B
LVIFDIDSTILNTTQRYKDAQRAGLIDKEGKAKRAGLQTPGNASKKAQDFLYTRESLQKDRAIPGAKDLIDHFIKSGHLIAYVTARSYKHFETTRDQLNSKEFPIFQTQDGKDLLSLNNKPGSTKANYKRGVFESLKAQYDIVAVFDDTVEVLQEAARMGIPGIYESINDYAKFLPKSNPGFYSSALDDKGHHREDPDADPYDTSDSHDDDSGMGRVPLKSKKARANPGVYTAESPKNTLAWIITDGPDADLIGTEIYVHAGFTAEHGQQYEGTSTNGTYIGELGDLFENEYLEPMGIGNHHTAKFDIRHDIIPIADTINFSDPRKNPSNSGKVMIKLKNKTQSDKVYKIRKALSEKGINFDTDVESGRYPRIMTFYLDQSLEGGTAKQVIAQLKKAKIPHTVEKVKQNPSNPGKIEKGKKLYKHMNGKEVGNQTTEKIDIGDTWYQVGEGGCWSIGYMSGKETKNKDQKYIHNFNEETKDGNVPKLYATMPDSGKPLLIIKGGTWKIKTDEAGMAWIYD